MLTGDGQAHAYCVDYCNAQTRFLDAFSKIVDWERADRDFV
ncbi:Fe-Mn family superoxide dismutase [Caballeronia sp.]